MEKHISKKLLAGVFALSSAFILASCDPITAVPEFYDDPIILNENNKGVEEDANKLGKIWDSIATDRNTTIISNLLEKVALNKFGEYDKIKNVTLLVAKESLTEEEKTELRNFISEHSSVFVRDNDGDGSIHCEKTAEEVQFNRLKIFCEDITSRISEAFWNEVNSGSYNDEEGRFNEHKMWLAHYYEFYDLKEEDKTKENVFFITGEHNKDNIWNPDVSKSYLKGEYSNPEGRGYIEEKIFPQILKDKLVEEYVYNNNPSALGRAYARKVRYVKVHYEEEYADVWKMLKQYSDKYIEGTPGNLPTEQPDFELIVKAMKGFDTVGKFKTEYKDPDFVKDGIIPLVQTEPGAEATEQVKNSYKAFELLSSTLGNINDDKIGVAVPAGGYKDANGVLLIPEGRYFKNTKLGKIIVSYQKAIKAENAGRFPIKGDKDELDKFAIDGKSKEYGLREQLISLAKEDYTTEGWYIKSGGLSELPAAIRDRLFNINVATKLDKGNSELVLEHPDTTEGAGDSTLGDYEKSGTRRLPYLRNLNGFKYVISSEAKSFAADHYNYLYQDKTGHDFYIVQVLEAPSTPKLNYQSESSYIHQEETKNDPYKTEVVARAVAKVLGTKDSYIKDAYTEALEPFKDSFVFYETSLYEHFKSEYPDLFEDED